MASTSASRAHGVAGRIQTAAATLYDDNQSLVVDIRKAVEAMKEIAVDLEREKQGNDMVKELEKAVIELMGTQQDCSHFSSAIQSVGENYQPASEGQLTNFKKLFEDEVAKVKGNSTSVPQNHPWIRQFREAIWNVHHAGEPMPGEEEEDLVMSSTQCNILNVTCPLSGKPITELQQPVRSTGCKHVYDKNAVITYLRAKNTRCPVAACPNNLQQGQLKCDEMLQMDIEELRKKNAQNVMTEVIEDVPEEAEDE